MYVREATWARETFQNSPLHTELELEPALARRWPGETFISEVNRRCRFLLPLKEAVKCVEEIAAAAALERAYRLGIRRLGDFRKKPPVETSQ